MQCQGIINGDEKNTCTVGVVCIICNKGPKYCSNRFNKSHLMLQGLYEAIYGL